MSLLETIRWAGGFRAWLRWKLWDRNLARCPYCRNMPEDEWVAMCDCFLPRYSGNWRRL